MASTSTKAAGAKSKRTHAQAVAAKANGKFQAVADSVPAQLEALKIGESFCRGARIPTGDFMSDEASEWLTKVTRVLSMQVARTKERNPKREYTIERLQGMAYNSPNLLCSIIVTRTA